MATTEAPAVHTTLRTVFPHRDGDHEPNLATLDQLRTRGRNALLSPRHRRRARPAGCTTC